jgi:hypothetical protein
MGTKPQSKVVWLWWRDSVDGERREIVLNIARIRPNAFFWIFGKDFFLIAPVGLLLEHMTKEFEQIFKKIRILKRVAYLVFFIVLCL